MNKTNRFLLWYSKGRLFLVKSLFFHIFPKLKKNINRIWIIKKYEKPLKRHTDKKNENQIAVSKWMWCPFAVYYKCYALMLFVIYSYVVSHSIFIYICLLLMFICFVSLILEAKKKKSKRFPSFNSNKCSFGFVT